jgi:hypothetical protein
VTRVRLCVTLATVEDWEEMRWDARVIVIAKEKEVICLEIVPFDYILLQQQQHSLYIYIYIYILCSLLVAIPLIIILIIMFPEFVLFYLCPIIKHGCTLHKYIYRHLDLSFKTPRKRDPIMAVPYLMVRTTKLFGICSCLCWGCFTLSHITI